MSAPSQTTPLPHFHTGLYEVHLPVTDVNRAVEFYVSRLGFEVGFSRSDGSGTLLLYTEGGQRWMLGLFRVDTVAHRTQEEYHISFRVSEERIDNMIPWLRAHGIEPEYPPRAQIQGPMDEPIVHGWMPAAAVFFRDPDGHLLEFIAELSQSPRPDFSFRPLSEWRALVRTVASND